MSFTLFSPDLLKSISKKIKLKSFSLHSFTILCEANHTYAKFPLHYLGLSGKSVELHHLRLVSDIKRNNSQAFRKHLRKYREDCEQYKQLNIYYKLQEMLNSSVWQRWLMNNQEISSRLEAIYKIWERNRKTSHLTNEALRAAAVIIIPLFENFHYLAKQEIKLHRKKLGEKIFSEASLYLRSLDKEIQDEKTKIVEAMLCRLEIASSKKNLRDGDINVYILEELKKLNITVEPNQFLKKSFSLDIFSYFHRYVFVSGNEQQRHRLKNLLWMREDRRFSMQLIDNEWVIIPNDMRQFEIPDFSRANFLLLNSWHNFKANFFKQNFEFLARLKLTLIANGYEARTIKELIEGDDWQKLLQLEADCDNNLKLAEQVTSSWFNKYFLSYKYKFFITWRNFAESTTQEIGVKKLDYAFSLCEQLRTRLVLDLDRELVLSLRTKDFLLKLINNMEYSVQSLSPQNAKKWYEIKKNFQYAINTPIDNSSEANFDFQPPPCTTKKIIDGLVSSKPAMQCYSNNAEIKLRRSLNAMTISGVFSLADRKFADQIVSLESELAQCSSYLLLPSFANFWNEMLSIYLRTCLCDKHSENESILRVAEILMKHSPCYVQDRMRALEQNKRENSIIFKTRCKAILFSLEDSINPESPDEVPSKFSLN